jgi:hypothetical protein
MPIVEQYLCPRVFGKFATSCIPLCRTPGKNVARGRRRNRILGSRNGRDLSIMIHRTGTRTMERR